MNALYWIPENLNKIINFDDIDNIDYNIFKLKYEDDKEYEDDNKYEDDKEYINNKNKNEEQYYRDIIQNSNNEKTFLTINFINGKYIKFIINKNEKLINIKIWLFEMIHYYDYTNKINEYLYPVFIYENKIINNISLTVSNINNDISCTIISKYSSMHHLICTNQYHFHNKSITFSPSCLGKRCLDCIYDVNDNISGILLPQNINIFKFPDIIPDEYIDEYTDIMWYNLKLKIDSHIEYRSEMIKKDSFSDIMYRIHEKSDTYIYDGYGTEDFIKNLTLEEKDIYYNFVLVTLK